MSYTSLWTIDKKWSGKEYATYSNSWLFPPVVWSVLMCKYIAPSERRLGGIVIESFMSWTGACIGEERNERFALLNKRINNSEIQCDRVLWELSNLSVFDAKNKAFVADCVEEFVKINIDSDADYKNAEHIKERFLEVAKDIRELPNRCKYFVIHPTSCDDNVEWWFNRKRLCSWNKFVCEFTLIENEKVVGFATNLEMCRKDASE